MHEDAEKLGHPYIDYGKVVNFFYQPLQIKRKGYIRKILSIKLLSEHCLLCKNNGVGPK